MIWGIDGYDGNNITYDDLRQLRNAGADICVYKSSMGWGDGARVAETVQWAKDLGFITAIYHWLDGTNTAQAQFLRFKKWIDLTNPDFVATDSEQWWADWAKYWQWAYGQIPMSQVPQLTDAQIDSVATGFLNKIKTAYPNLYNTLYTAKWFEGFDEPMRNWISQYPLWVASYPTYPDQNFGTWSEFQTYLNWLQIQQPVMPTGAISYDLWQPTGRAYFPPTLYGPWDINIFKGTRQQFIEKIHTPVPPIPPPPPVDEVYMVKVTWLTVHSGPSTSYPKVEWLPMNTVKTVTQKSGTFGMFEVGHWMNCSSTYCKKIA